jgi:hypothetical protein
MKTEVSEVSIDMRNKILMKMATGFACKKVLIYCIIVELISTIISIFLNVPSIQNCIDKGGAFGFTKAKTKVVYS